MDKIESPFMRSQPPLSDAEEAQLEEDLEWARDTFDNSDVEVEDVDD